MGVTLLLLDLSVAFDTVDHELLLETVERTVGLGGRCLDWLRGYLSGRVQSVAVGNGRSTNRRLVCGVVQGSVLDPLLLFTGEASLVSGSAVSLVCGWHSAVS